MNRPINPKKRSAATMPTIAAQLDLTNEGHLRLHDLIRRMHTGRWPLFISLGMRQVDGVIYEAAQWARMKTPTFSVITWHQDGFGMDFEDAPTASHARRILNAK